MTTATPAAQRDLCERARQAIQQRRAVLGPCLTAMGFSEHGAPPAELPDPLLFCGLEVSLESWERNVLSGRNERDSAVLLAHFAEGVAFRALSESRLKTLGQRSSEPGEQEQTRIALIEENAVGMALQQEIQRDIDRLVGKGEMGDAKKLTGFRRKIDQFLARLDEQIDVREREQAQARAVELLTPREAGQSPRREVPPPVEKGLTLEDLYEMEKTLDKEIDERPPEPSAKELYEASLRDREEGTQAAVPLTVSEPHRVDPARRFGLLMGLLVVSIVAYAVTFVTTREEAPPPRLGMEHFQHIEAVLDVKPRPPSLFVRVKVSNWTAIPAPEQKQLVEELGRIAGEKGYEGVQVETSDGANVGQWLRKTGARLAVVPEVAS